MKLSDLFTSTADKAQEPVPFPDHAQNAVTNRIPKQIQALTPGNVLQGEVVEKSGNEVKIKIAGDFLLAARLDQEVNVEEGRLLTFEVKNNGKSLSLSPLFANTASSDNIMKALQMANLPVNGKTIEMTELMMKQGMSVDSHSLHNMFKDVTVNGQVPVSNIVKLHQMQIPVNNSNITQLQSYLDMTHHLIEGFETIIASVPDTIQELVNTQGKDKATDLLKQIMNDLFPKSTMHPEDVSQDTASAIKADPIVMSGSIQFDQTIQTMEEQAVDNTISIVQQESLAASEKKPTVQDILSDLFKQENNKEEPQTALTKQPLVTGDTETVDLSNKGISDNNTATLNKLLHTLKEPAFFKMIQEEFKNQWTLSPEQIADKEQVKEVYERIRNQLESLKDTLEHNGAGQSTLAKETTNLRQNIDFMNQLNQVYTYIQLPLKMAQRATNGELYVFTNRQNLAKQDGQVSALLHLNMDNLGMIDVYIAMQNHNLNTRFTVKDDDMLDFLNQHMDLLNNRLAQKGYSMHCEMKVRDIDEKRESVIDILSGKDSKEQLLAQYAFDVRA